MFVRAVLLRSLYSTFCFGVGRTGTQAPLQPPSVATRQRTSCGQHQRWAAIWSCALPSNIHQRTRRCVWGTKTGRHGCGARTAAPIQNDGVVLLEPRVGAAPWTPELTDDVAHSCVSKKIWNGKTKYQSGRNIIDSYSVHFGRLYRHHPRQCCAVKSI